MENKRKYVIVGAVTFVVLAGLVGILCGIFIPKLINDKKTGTDIVVTDNPSTTTTSVLSTIASTNATVSSRDDPDEDRSYPQNENEETTFTSTTTTSATTSATTTTTSTTTTTTTTTSTTTTTLPAIESGAPLIEYLHEANGKGILEDLELTVEKDDLRIHLVNVTSGSWLPEVSNVPIWSHYLMIIVPLYSNIKLSGKAMLYSTEQVAPISGDITTTPTAEVAMRIAKESGSVTGLLYGNPHGPLVFSDDARQDMELYGSSLLAYSWNKTLDRAQDKPETNIIFPVLRSIRYAMDSIQKFLGENYDLDPINDFCVMSEVPFASWMAGVDPRVKCSIPILSDMVNATATLQRHYRSMAAWSYHWGGFGPIFDKIGSRPVYDLFRHVDPAYQNDRFKQDVLMLRAGNDESMVPDSTRDYYDKMANNQRVYLRTLPNALHGAELDSRFMIDIIAFYTASQSTNLTSGVLPSMNWSMKSNDLEGSIEADVSQRPIRVTAWMAETRTRFKRDFRLQRLSKDGLIPQRSNYSPFTSSPFLLDLTNYDEIYFGEGGASNEKYTFRATFSLPKDGYWKAFFIEFEFIGPYGRKLILTTETMVIPEELPWTGCWPDQRRQKFYNCTTQYERRFL